MRPEHDYFLVEEVYVHCNFALSGLVTVTYHLEDEFNYQHKGIWADLQMGLTNAAIVSAYLFSTRPNTQKRTDFLKAVLKPSENSPLINKVARNYLTHVDEKFDYWLNNENDFSGMLEAVLPNRKGYDYVNSDRYFVRRVLLKEELVFIFQTGQERGEYEIKPLITELELILKNADNYLSKLETEDNGLHFVRPK